MSGIPTKELRGYTSFKPIGRTLPENAGGGLGLDQRGRRGRRSNWGKSLHAGLGSPPILSPVAIDCFTSPFLHIVLGVLLLTVLYPAVLASCWIEALPTDEWPEIPKLTNSAAIRAAIDEYNRQGADWRRFTQSGPYQRGGDYLNWAGSVWSPAQWENTKGDVNGVIMQSYDRGATYVYQPNTITQYALWLYSDYKHGRGLPTVFWTNVNALKEMQLPDGTIPYHFDFNGEAAPLAKGWVSGMEQGQAVSLFLRAFKLSKDAAYFRAASNAIQVMLYPEGGMGSLADLNPTLARYPMVAEYIFTPDVYTLDGSMFAMLGLYDWVEYQPAMQCVFDLLLETLHQVLPYYDAQVDGIGYSLFDLSHMVYEGRSPVILPIYHQFNTALVWAFDQLAPHPQLNRIWKTWANDVGQPLPDPPKLSIQYREGAVFLSWNDANARVQTSSGLDVWRDLPSSTVAGQLALPTSGLSLFFRLKQ